MQSREIWPGRTEGGVVVGRGGRKRAADTRGHARALRGVKTDLDARVEQEAIVVGGKPGVSGGFEQAEGEVPGRPKAFVEDVA